AVTLGGSAGSDAFDGAVLGFRAGVALYPGEARGWGFGVLTDFITAPKSVTSLRGGLGLELSMPLASWDESDFRIRPYVIRRVGLDPDIESSPHVGVGIALSASLPWTVFDFDYAGLRTECLFDSDGFDGILFQFDITALLVLFGLQPN
ncbi:MAG: hypothetical protein AAFQ82_18985, partial [Myxococcota bacterium]